MPEIRERTSVDGAPLKWTTHATARRASSARCASGASTRRTCWALCVSMFIGMCATSGSTIRRRAPTFLHDVREVVEVVRERDVTGQTVTANLDHVHREVGTGRDETRDDHAPRMVFARGDHHVDTFALEHARQAGRGSHAPHAHRAPWTSRHRRARRRGSRLVAGSWARRGTRPAPP